MTCTDTDLCNEEFLLPISTTTEATSWVSSTTKATTKKEPTTRVKGTTHLFSPRSGARMNKNENNWKALTLLTLIIYHIF